MKTYLRVVSYTKPYKDYVVQYFVVAFIASVFGLLNFTLIIPLLKVLFEKTSEIQRLPEPEFSLTADYLIDLFYYHFNRIAIDKGAMEVLQFVCIAMIGAAFIANFFRYISLRIVAIVKSRLVYNLRKEIYSRMLNLHTGYFTNAHKGDLISRLTNDILEIEVSVANAIVAVFRDPIKIILCFVALFYISTELTIFTLIFMPITGGITAEILKRLRKVANEGQIALGRIMGTVEESISAIKIIKAFNAHGFMNDKFKSLNHHYAHTIKKLAFKRDSASPTSEFLGIIIVAGLMLYGGNLVFNGDLKGETFIAFIVLFTQILAPAKSISAAFSNVQRGIASAERVFNIIDTIPHIQNNDNPIELKEFNDKITFSNVSFEYEKDEKVLNNINIEIHKGHTVALVGPSGGGKSTISDLIPRFFDPTEGAILLDGKNLKHCTVNSVRNLMGIVAQEPLLFDDTIYNNIAFGIDNPTKEMVINAAKIANAHDFIINTTEGYDTVIGDRGVKLSGGQKQRLSIARAVLKNPPILILDEATSALDTESEKLVQDAITNLMKNRTSVVIAHRLSTIQDADTILVIEKGNIVEKGTHHELVSIENGLYSKLSKMQMT